MKAEQVRWYNAKKKKSR